MDLLRRALLTIRLSWRQNEGGTAMNIRAAILVFALLPAALFADDTDVIVMTNGDHMTGEIKGLDQGTLYVSLGYVISTMSVQWSKVARLESKHLFIVKTEDGSVYRGTLNVSEASGSSRPVRIELAEAPEKRRHAGVLG